MKLSGPDLRRDAERRREITAMRGESSPCRLGPLERKVRPSPKHWCPERAARLDLSLLEREREFMWTTPKGNHRSYCVKVKAETLK
jgi:hypothetical protein